MLAESIALPIQAIRPYSQQLDIQIGYSRDRHSFVRRQYATYPFRLSRPLRIDPSDPQRVYLYVMNTSPGLLAGDELHQSLHLDNETSLYLTDQSATKVHSMAAGTRATIHTTIHIGANATLEWLPEPVMLYADATLEQTTTVTMHSTSRLFLSEMLVPGRLARGEVYKFEHYFSRLQVKTSTGQLLFTEAMRLEGKTNLFCHSPLFSRSSAMATLIIVQPEIDVQTVMSALNELSSGAESTLIAACSPLPNCRGVVVRATADRISTLKAYCQSVVHCIRQATGQPDLPEIPK